MALLSLTLLIAACGDESAALDHGGYALEPIPGDFDDAPSRVRGSLVESVRIGERLLFADRVDPDLVEGDGGGVVVGVRGVDELLSGVQQTALQPFDVQAGFGAIGSNGRSDNEQQHKLLSITILSLPDAEQAGAAAQAMAAADFGANTENAPLPLPDYPAALSHWRPGVPTVGSWLVWKNLVIRLYAKVVDPRPEVLTDLLTRTYRAQLAELDTFVPTPAADLAALKLDSEHLLTRVVKTGEYWPDRWDFLVYGPRTYALLLDKPSARLREFEQSKIDAIAVSYNKFLHRASDEQTARTYAEAEERLLLSADFTAMSEVPGPDGVSCYRASRPNTEVSAARRFACLVRRDEFVVRVYSNQETDVRQLAVAQYALLSGSR
ncbi:hypothetical protein ATM97_10160 [Nocardia sp. MH4]|uniref:DUF7373 family lipoprotein n=1 Tax=Nocardia sp. MH4 TaxID=1768677 RepID=UPI001C4E2F9B|nr:hypothetical protein [Nocardia sp. MH4]MBW0271183.1 hypothetical protein [Nocardia sp. MH4]